MTVDAQSQDKIQQLATENRGLLDSNRRMTAEVARLRERVALLEAEIGRGAVDARTKNQAAAVAAPSTGQLKLADIAIGDVLSFEVPGKKHTYTGRVQKIDLRDDDMPVQLQKCGARWPNTEDVWCVHPERMERGGGGWRNVRRATLTPSSKKAVRRG